jgi:hypothetical protein
VALGNLHRHTGNTRLLKKANRDEMSFRAVGPQTSAGFQAGGWNDDGEITFVNLPGKSDSDIQRTVYHEFGHNWDDPSENAYAATFRAVSGWKEHDGNAPPEGYLLGLSAKKDWVYLASADDTFARDYGKTNPFEDMATTWEAYFVFAYHGGATGLTREGLKKNADKWATIDSLINDLHLDW